MIRQKNKGLSLIKTLYFVNLAKASMVLLFLFLIFSCFPPAPTVNNEATAATTYLFTSAQTAPTLSLTTDKSSISITANPTSTLATGKVTNTVSTTNYAGYKLTANLSGTSTNLTHSTISSKNIPSITSTYTSTNFPTGYWGVSLDDTNYQALPASNATALQLKNQTAAATNQTVALTVGAKVNQNQANGNYTNTINLTATANAASYTITYDKNTTDTVSNLPSAQTGTVSSSAVALSSNTPTRTGYTFLGWSEDSAATAATFTNGASVYFSQTQDNTNIKLYAVWKINTYTVTLAVDNYGYGTLTKYSQTANHGSAVSTNGSTVTIAGTTITAAPIDPTERFIYSFDGWTNGCGATVTGNCTITARFTRVSRTYTVTFAVNTSGYGTVSRSSQSVTYEAAVSISGATATVAGTNTTATATTATAQYSYAFSNWTNNCGTTVTANCTITANFTRTTRSYTVTFAVSPSGYGTTSRSTQTVTYGGAVSTSGATATVASTATTASAAAQTAQYTYAFSSWTNGCGTTVTGNCTITANFTRSTRSYTVTFAVNTSGYGSLTRTSQASIPYGTAVSISGATTTINSVATTATATTATAQYSYAFSNWTNGCGTSVTGNCTITANFTRTTRSYTVTFAVNTTGYGTVSRATQTVTYGGAVSTSGATATVAGTNTTATATAATAQYSYAFSSWTNNCGATVTGNCTITANFTRTTRSYTVTFAMNPTSGYGSLTRTSQSVAYGSAVSISGATVTISSTATTATASGMNAFTGWTNGCGSTVTGACTITAGFREATMQDIGSIKSQLALETQYQLKDSRDGKWYWVAKLKDGNIWMTQNLDYDISASSNTVSKTDGTTSTWGSSSTNAPKATSTSVVNSSNNADTYSYDYGNQYVPGGSGTATAATDLTSSAAKGDTNLHYHLGNLYQWNAVTAGTGAGLATGSNATTSICPAGWRLPISGDYTSNYSFGKLTNAYGATSSTAGTTTANVNTMKAAPLYFTFAGNTDRGGPWSKGTIGYYWASTVQSSGNTYRLTINPSAANKVAPNDFQSQFMGFSVRCVAI